MKILRIPLLTLLVVVAGLAFNANAQKETNLYTFGSYPTDGAHPYAGLVQGSDSNLYGTTSAGGTNNAGTVFTITAQGTVSTLHLFNGDDGYSPVAGLVQGSDSNFYGTTEYGGAYNNGTVFQITSGGTLTLLHSFNGDDGYGPVAGLVQGSDSNFYGTTYAGGTSTNCAGGCGTVFQITSAGTFTMLYSFSGSDGLNQRAGLVHGSDGNFYGTTKYGGTNNDGTVFQITSGGTLTLLHSFNGDDGEFPVAGLVQGSDSNFYGTTSEGGGVYDAGTVFQITSAGTLTSLHSFNGSDGNGPFAALAQGNDGDFYGTTVAGGTSTNCPGGCGTVFQITSAGTLTMLYSFSGSDGLNPRAGLVQGIDTNFYGTTLYGGTNNDGTVFKLIVLLPNSWINAGNSKWEMGTNWSSGFAPSTNDVADLITNAGDKTVTIDAPTVLSNAINGCLTINNLYIAGTASSTNTLFLNNSGTATPLQVLSSLTVDANGALVVNNSATVVTNGQLYVGNTGGNASLIITNGGAVYSGNGNVGNESPSSNNAVLVAGPGSVWSNSDGLSVGELGAGNSLVISNGGAAYALFGVLGYYSSSNTVVVTGTNSVWSNSSTLTVGQTGPANRMIIGNGGAVYDNFSFVGYESPSSNNVVLVTGTNSIWSSGSGLYVGVDDDGGDQMIISNGGAVYDSEGYVGNGGSGGNNIVLVTGPGSIWSNSGTMSVGEDGDSLVISNGGAVVDEEGTMGINIYSSNNTVLVTGPGSVWNSSSYLYIGDGGASNTLTIANAGAVLASAVTIGYSGMIGLSSNNLIRINGGSLTVTDDGYGVLLLGNGGGGVAALILSNGMVTADQLVLTNGANSVFTFNAGTLTSGGTFVTNDQVFAVGDSTDAATFQLNGGMHDFANNLEIRSNAALAGCGTINGNVVVDPGGTVLANCGGNLNFTGTVTNNGTITASDGTVLNFYGPVVNIGLIDATGGSVHFFSSLNGSGSLLLPPTNSWIAGNGKWETGTNWSSGVAPSLADSADVIANAGKNTVTIDGTTATNFPNTLTISNLFVGAPGPMTNTLLLSNAGTNAPLVVLDSVSVSHRGSVLLTNSALQVGGASGGALTIDGQLTMESGTTLVSSNLLVGPSNPLSLVTVTGGALYVTNAAHNAVSEVRFGTLVLTGGVYFTDSLLITNTGANFLNDGGTFTITGLGQVDQGTQTVASGTTQLSSNLVVGTSANSTGTVNVTGGSLVVTNATITIGNLGVGSMTVSSGTVSTTGIDIGAGTNSLGTLTLQDGSSMTVSSNLTAGSALGSTGMVIMTGGSLVATGGVIGVGNDGSTTNGTGMGSMTVSNATVLASTILLGSSAGGQGSLTIQTNGVVSLNSGAAGTNAVVVCNDLILDGGLLSMTNGTLYCGDGHTGAMTMSNGTALCQIMYVGYDYPGMMTMVQGQMTISTLLVIGQLAGSTGSVWVSEGQLTAVDLPTIIGNSGVGQMSISNGILQGSTMFVGNSLGPGGTVTVSGGTLSLNTGLNVGTPFGATGTVWVTGGQLLVPTGNIVIGNAGGIGQFTISNGLVQANSLVLTNGTNSQFTLSGGTLASGGTVVTNGQRFVVGNGSSAAAFTMVGGAHSFGNGLEIANNGALSGCGTINGNVKIDSGATVLANCGGTLTFAAIVTNNGTMRANGGSVLESYGTLVNNGTIDIINGGKSFHGTFVNNGTVLDASSVKVSQVSQSGQDFVVQIPSVTGHTYQLQFRTSLTPTNWTSTAAPQSGTGGVLTFTDPGGATNLPARFYRVDCTAP